MEVKNNVQSRYAEGAIEKQEALCCPVNYQTHLLEILPQEIIEKDYGCGDPSRYVQLGDTVLDLGSGGGKICYMAAQLVGSNGHVIGVDMTDEMLALANKYRREMAEKIGGDRVDFRKGYIQDLALDVKQVAEYLASKPISNNDELNQFEEWKNQQKQDDPLVESNSVDLVISNCVLNLVDKNDRSQLLNEIYRVLKPGGRVAISDIVSDEHVPESLQKDSELWSGCISGAFQEEEFLDAFLEAGFVAVGYDKWDEKPWRVVEGIEFRSVTLVATKPSKKNLYDAGQALLYKGPFKVVSDDLGNEYVRGKRTAVSKRTFDLVMSSNMSDDFIGFSPVNEVNHGCFCKPKGSLRPIEETKGGLVNSSSRSESSCC